MGEDNSLQGKKCVACEGGVSDLPLQKIEKYLSQVDGWSLEEVDGVNQIIKEFKFKDFKEALDFVNKVGEIAEQEGHHPNIYLHDYNQVKLILYTHAIKGLHDNDFIIAYKIDALNHGQKEKD